MSYCDSHNNCLPPWLGTWVPLITYGATCLSYLLSMLDSLQPETTAEKIETASVCWSNFMVRTVSLVLALSCLGWLWTGVLVSVVLSLDGLYVGAVCLPEPWNNFTDYTATATGWGEDREGAVHEFLQQLEVRILSQCGETGGAPGQLCASPVGNGSLCRKDEVS